MYNYEIILYWSSEDNLFIAEAPELPGCMADGQTRMDALTNIETIIDEWIETATALGREIPKPKGRLHYSYMSTKCTIIIRREENWYVATDIHSGVASQGKTIDEATTNLKEALSLYYEDNKLQGGFENGICYKFNLG